MEWCGLGGGGRAVLVCAAKIEASFSGAPIESSIDHRGEETDRPTAFASPRHVTSRHITSRHVTSRHKPHRSANFLNSSQNRKVKMVCGCCCGRACGGGGVQSSARGEGASIKYECMRLRGGWNGGAAGAQQCTGDKIWSWHPRGRP